MATIDELIIELSAENKQLLDALKESSDATQKSSDAMMKALDELAGKGDDSTKHLSESWAVMAGVLGADAVVEAVKLFGEIFKEVVEEGVEGAIRYEDALHGLNNALSLTGNFSNEGSKDLEDYAKHLADTTIYSDEAALGSMRMLASLSQLSGDGLKKATQASADLASFLQVDLVTATNLVAKAIDGNDAQLKKHGITLEGFQQGIKNTDLVVSQLAEHMAGTAASQINTFGGEVTQAQKSFEDFAKQIGLTITTNQSLQNVLGVVAQIFKELEQAVETNKTPIREFIDNFVLASVSVGKAVVEMADYVRIGFNVVGSVIGNEIGVIIEDTKALNQLLTGDVKGALATFMDAGKNAFENVRDEATKPNAALEFMKQKFDQLGNAAADGMGKVNDVSEQASKGISNASQKTQEFSVALQELGIEGKKIGDSLAASTTDINKQYSLQTEYFKTQNEAKLIDYDTYWNEQYFLLQDNLLKQRTAIEAAHTQGKLDEDKYQKALLGLQQETVVKEAKFSSDKKKADDAFDKQKLDATAQTFGNIAVLMQSGNSTLFEIGKQAAAAQAIVQGILAVQQAYSAVPFPFNIALAASIGVATAANVAKIESTSFSAAEGIDDVPGSGIGDKVPFMLEPGERVVPKNTNQDLKNFLQNGASGPSMQVNITMNDIFNTDPRTLGLEIVNVINEAAQANNIKFVGVKFI